MEEELEKELNENELKPLAYRGNFMLWNLVTAVPFTAGAIVLFCRMETLRQLPAALILLFFGIVLFTPCIKTLCNPKVPIKYDNDGIYLYYMLRKRQKFIAYGEIISTSYDRILHKSDIVGRIKIVTASGKFRSLCVDRPVEVLERLDELKKK